MDKYSVSVFWSEEDGGYIATVPELPGLSAFGETATEAIDELYIAKEAYVAVFENDGCKLPEPDTIDSYSGQTRLRLPKSLHAELSRIAKKEGVSFNTLVISLLSDRLSTHRVLNELDKINSNVQNVYNLQISGTYNQVFDEIGSKPSTDNAGIDLGLITSDNDIWRTCYKGKK